MENLKLRWEKSNPGTNIILDKILGWADVNAELRINLLGWLTTQSDDQILDDVMEMVDALENVANNNTVTHMGDNIMINVVEMCTPVQYH